MICTQCGQAGEAFTLKGTVYLRCLNCQTELRELLNADADRKSIKFARDFAAREFEWRKEWRINARKHLAQHRDDPGEEVDYAQVHAVIHFFDRQDRALKCLKEMEECDSASRAVQLAREYLAEMTAALQVGPLLCSGRLTLADLAAVTPNATDSMLAEVLERKTKRDAGGAA